MNERSFVSNSSTLINPQTQSRDTVDEAWFNQTNLYAEFATGSLRHDLIAGFESDMFPTLPQAFYHDCWWVWDGARGIYSGYGINGQQLLIHRPANTVIARLSTWPARWSSRLFALADAANVAVLEHLAA